MNNIIIIGDLMIDHYVYCNTRKINQEAPNIVFNHNKDIFKLGGAANIAKNLSNLDFNVFFISDLGNNKEYSETILKLLKNNNIYTDYLIQTNKKTTVKKRYISNQIQVFRIDNEDTNNISNDYQDIVFNNFLKLINNNRIKYLVVSDYNKGFLTLECLKKIITKCNLFNIKVFIDPKINKPEKYKNSYLIKPNRNEFEELCKYYNFDYKDFNNSVINISNKLNVNNLVITKDKDETILYQKNINKFSIIKNKIKKDIVVDVTGAGDVVLSCLIYFFDKYSLEKVIEYSNKIATYSVGFIGCFELNKYVINRILNNTKVIKSIDYMKKDKKVVFTNGCFDLIHSGHIEYLKKCKDYGDILIIGLNSDNSIKRLKGNNRPINKLEDRISILQSFEFVDYIIVFDEDTPYELIKKIKPDVLIKGGDYKIEEIVGRDIAKETIVLEFKKGYSSTKIIEKIISLK